MIFFRPIFWHQICSDYTVNKKVLQYHKLVHFLDRNHNGRTGASHKKVYFDKVVAPDLKPNKKYLGADPSNSVANIAD